MANPRLGGTVNTKRKDKIKPVEKKKKKPQFQKPKSSEIREKAQAAYKQGSQRSGLGTKVKTHTTKVKADNGVSWIKSTANSLKIKGNAEKTKQTTDKFIKVYQKKEGLSDAQVNPFINEKNKQIDKSANKAIKANQNKTKKENPKYYKNTYEDLKMTDYGKMTTAAMTGQMPNLMKNDKKLAKKVADRNVQDYIDSKGAMGFLDQMTQVRSVSNDPTYKYTKDQKAIMEKAKQSKAYMGGRMVGAVGEFALGGTAQMGTAIAKTGGKAALKAATKQGGKSLANEVRKRVVKETAADTLVSLPLNTLDAYKDSVKDGKLNKLEFVKNLGLNVGGDIVIGGAVSGITHGLSASQVAKFNRINKQFQIDKTKLSESDIKFYAKHVAELGDKVDGAVKASSNEPKISDSSDVNTPKAPDANEGVKVAETNEKAPISPREKAIDNEIKRLENLKNEIQTKYTENGVVKYSDEIKRIDDRLEELHAQKAIDENAGDWEKYVADDVGAQKEIETLDTSTGEGRHYDDLASDYRLREMDNDDSIIPELTHEENERLFGRSYEELAEENGYAQKSLEDEELYKSYGGEDNINNSYNDVYNDLNGLDDYLKGVTFNVRNVMGDFPDFNDFKKKNFRKVHMTAQEFKGSDISQKYEELKEIYPGYFPDGIDTQAQQLERIIEVRNLLVEAKNNLKQTKQKKLVKNSVLKANYKSLDEELNALTIERKAINSRLKNATSDEEIILHKAHHEEVSDRINEIRKELSIQSPSGRVIITPNNKQLKVLNTKTIEAYKTADPKRIGTDSTTSSYVKEYNVPDSHKSIFHEFINATNMELRQAVLNIRNGKLAGKKKYKAGTVNNSEAERLKELLGVDVSNFKRTVEADELVHIEERHGINGIDNKTMVNANDIARMEYVLDNADSIELSTSNDGIQKYSRKYRENDKTYAPLVQYKKQINGEYIVYEAVADVASKELRVESVFFNTGKINEDVSKEANAILTPASTSETAAQLTSPSSESVAKSGSNVKTKQKRELNPDGSIPENLVLNKQYNSIQSEIDALIKERKRTHFSGLNTKNEEHRIVDNAHHEQIQKRLDELYAQKKAQTKQKLENPSQKDLEDVINDSEANANGSNKDAVEQVHKETATWWDTFMRKMTDSFRGFENFARELPSEFRKELRGQINRVRNSENVANAWLYVGRSSVNGKKTGKSLKEIFGKMLLAKNANEYADFQDYVFHLHNVDRYKAGKGIFEDITDVDSAQIVKELEEKYPHFKDKQAEFKQYFADLQQYRVDCGLISKELADELDALYPNYVPTFRVVDGKTVRVNESKNITQGNSIHYAKGGGGEILPLHEQMVNLTNSVIKLGERNRLMDFIAKTQGAKLSDLPEGTTLKDLEEVAVYPVRHEKGYSATYFVNGERKTVSITEQMYLGLKEWHNPEDMSALIKFNKSVGGKAITRANQMFKNLITGWNPIFGARNIIRDTGEALLYTKNVKGFIKAYPKAIAAVTGGNKQYKKYYELYQACGGKYSQLREIQNALQSEEGIKGLVKKYNPVELCARFNDGLEAIPRLAEFISTIENNPAMKELLEKAEKNGSAIDSVLDSMDSKLINEAMLNANDVTLNFGRSGVTTKALNSSFIPYFNPAIQGVDKLVRVFKESKEGGAKGMMSLLMKIGTFAVAPAMVNEFLMSTYGGEEFEQLNTRDKNNNYFIPMGDGKFIKIPKSRVGAALSSPFTHLMRAEYGGFNKLTNSMEFKQLFKTGYDGLKEWANSMEFEQLFKTGYDNIGVMNPLDSNLFSPIILAANNKTWYGGEIESYNDLKAREAGERRDIYSPTTSGIAIAIGDKLNMSPKKIDYIIDAYTGVIGDILIPATAESSKGNPLYKNFILDSVFSNKLSTEFWEKNAHLEAVSSYRDNDKHENWEKKYCFDIYRLNDAIADIKADKKLSKSEKTKKERELKIVLNKIYRSGLSNKTHEVEPISEIAKVLGATRALEFLPTSDKDPSESYSGYYKEYKSMIGYKGLTKAEKKKADQQFLDTYSEASRAQRQYKVDYQDSPDWGIFALVNAKKKNPDEIALARGVYPDTIEKSKEYLKNKGTIEEYVKTQQRINMSIEKIGKSGTSISKKSVFTKSVQKGAKALSLAKSNEQFVDRAYTINDIPENKMYAGRGIDQKYNWNTIQLAKLGSKADKDGNGYLKRDEVVEAIDNSRAKTDEERALLYVLIMDSKSMSTPYGTIPKYSVKGDTGFVGESSSGGGGGRSRKRSGRRSSGGSSFNKSWESYVKENMSTAKTRTRATPKWKATMTDSDRNKLNKLRKNM